MSYPLFDLSGKVALITGGNRGIGFGMAEGLAQAGCDVAIWGRDSARNEEAVQSLLLQGVRAKAYEVDVSQEKAVSAGIAEVLADFGRLDSVFANAGIGGTAPAFLDADAKELHTIVSTNLDGAFFTLREACKHMAARAKAGDPGGSLVAISSIAARVGAPRMQAYAATKAALLALIRGIAVEYAGAGIRANAILPGWIATDLTAPRQASKTFTERTIGRVPFKRWGEPSDFAGIAVYLTSDASAFHTGAEFVIDGGFSIA
ncbi:MAG TPA: SDR family oxidoreductase [Caulobacterales bacterium]|nr:SDR family oxidoreductase [Caulobacterales bacterium]